MPAARTALSPKATAPANLTRDPHNGLGREHVAGIQRARMIAAMAHACAELGAANVTVAHVVQRAGVSRRTFYEVFDDTGHCFMAAFEHALEQATRRVQDAYAPDARWVERMRASLVALLAYLDENPLMGRLMIVESLGAGTGALCRRQEVLARAIAAVDEGRGEANTTPGPSSLTAEGTVGGVLSILHARLSERAHRPLAELAGSLMSMIVLPYLGQAAARRELSRPAPVPSQPPIPAGHDQLRELGMRLTYRTVRVLGAIAAHPGSSNRRIADAAEIADQGQMSKLLNRLQQLGLVENAIAGKAARGEPNVWVLTSQGWRVQDALERQAAA